MSILIRFASLLLLTSLLALPTGVHAAQSYASCTGYIDSLPATISTQGVWCLRQDLSTAITAGAAITLAANNITLDCNDYKVGGLAGGTQSEAIGIAAPAGRLNAVVRRCGVRGFRTGVRLEGAGHVVEENRIDGSTLSGIHVEGDGIIVRGNLVGDLFGRSGQALVTGIVARGDGVRVVDNDIRHINGSPQASGKVLGLSVENGLAQDNRISALHGSMFASTAIELVRSVADHNIVSVYMLPAGVSIQGDGEALSICRDNIIAGLMTAPADCKASGNVHTPYNPSSPETGTPE